MPRFYFAYGSNMKRSRLEGRTGTVIDHGLATLKDYRITFNKLSTDESGKTNIMPAERQDVLGVLYELSENQLKILDDFEKGYKQASIVVDVGGEMLEVQTYIAMDEHVKNDLLPTAEYLGHLIDGAKDHNFPNVYQEFLKAFEVCK